MAIYTFEQFEQAAKNAGLYDRFSSADLSLAQQNPDAGMSILKYKQDYANATTDEARALANLGAEGIRSSYGSYKGGDNGGSFYLDPLSPSSFNAGKAPTYTNKYEDDIADLYEQQKNYGSFEYDIPAPEYTNRYDGTIQQLLGEILNREDFSYDPAADPLYSQYRKQYAREGQRATQDAMGAAAAASGGIPSSYAATAASQAGNYYAAQMTDKIPELYQLAYNRYLNDYDMQMSSLNAVQGAEQNDYSKYLNELQQYNTDRAFDYNAWMDGYNMIANNLNTATGLEQMDYNKFLNDLNQYNTDRAFNYGVLLDEINSQTAERNEAMNKALTAAEYGDYSFLQDMGINTDNNPTDWERQYTLALLAAEYGDFSGLQALGINPDAANLNSFNNTVAGKAVASGNKSSGDGYNNGGYSASEIKKLQTALGVTADGMFGKNSTAAMKAAGYNSLEEAYAALVGNQDTADTSLNSLKQDYPDGVISDQSNWDYLVGVYGESALKAAGFSRGKNKETTDQMPASGEDKQRVQDIIQKAWKAAASNIKYPFGY